MKEWPSVERVADVTKGGFFDKCDLDVPKFLGIFEPAQILLASLPGLGHFCVA